MSDSIPKIIWQTWCSIPEVPAEGKRSVLSWSSRNPTWSYQFCSDEDVAEFFGKFCSEEFARLFTSLPVGEMKAGLWKYAVLHEFGGVYAEMGSICRAPLDEWLDRKSGKGLHVACDNGLPQFCHRTIVATKGHPVLKTVIELITQRVNAEEGLGELPADGKDRSIGAEIWTEAIQRYLGRKEEPMTLYHRRASLADKDIEIHPCYFFNGVKVRQQAGSEALGC